MRRSGFLLDYADCTPRKQGLWATKGWLGSTLSRRRFTRTLLCSGTHSARCEHEKSDLGCRRSESDGWKAYKHANGQELQMEGSGLRSRLRVAHRRRLGLDGGLIADWGRRGMCGMTGAHIPLPDGESGEVKEGERLLGVVRNAPVCSNRP